MAWMGPRPKPKERPVSRVESQSNGAEVHLVFELPPTTNKLYQARRGGGKALTKVANKFRENVKKKVAESIASIGHLPTGLEDAYEIHLRAYFDTLQNAGWFQTGRAGQRKAQTRYKKLDVDNRIKFLQDSVTKSLGIQDDSHYFRIILEKFEDPNNPRAEVRIRVIDATPHLVRFE